VAAAEGILLFRRKRGDGDAYLTVDGKDIEERTELALKWTPLAATWTVIGDAEEHRTSEIRKPILEVVSNTDEPIGPTDVADALDEPVNKIKQRMYQMSRPGALRVVSRGRYVIATRNLHYQNDQKVTEVMKVMNPHNQNGYHSISADAGNALVDELKKEGVREEAAAKAVMNMMVRRKIT
jgi:hypothetical protein